MEIASGGLFRDTKVQGLGGSGPASYIAGGCNGYLETALVQLKARFVAAEREVGQRRKIRLIV